MPSSLLRRPHRLIRGHPRIFGSLAVGLIALGLLPHDWDSATRAIVAWDCGTFFFLLLSAFVFSGERISRMARDAERQQEGEWTAFVIALAAVLFSLSAIFVEFGGFKDLPPTRRGLHAVLVIVTLLLSWLSTHVLFAYRYAHEYYERSGDRAEPDRGLDFPNETQPDYWDFLYFLLVLGMTFQVSDVNVTSRKMRRLAIAHSFLSFLFNTVILALSVNIGSGLL